jgi:type III pantothenate kinase
MRCLLIDGGNSRIKWALVVQNQWIESGLVDYQALSVWCPPTNLDAIGWLCVSKAENQIQAFVEKLGINHFRLAAPFPDGLVNSHYNLLELGPDRFALIAGALHEFGPKPLVILSLGTCLTMDFCAEGIHLGGFISPGLTMRLEAMHRFTGKLPLLHPPSGHAVWPGRHTAEAMQEGARQGILAEMKAFLAQAALQYPDVLVVLCGGDAPIFENAFEKPIFARPHLVLQGLAAIILHHDNTP